jgi:hypothetical protein
VETVLKAIRSEHADYATFGYASVNVEGKILSEFIPDASVKTFRGSAVWEQFLPGLVSPDYLQKRSKQFYMSACFVMYSMAVIRSSGWRFVSEREVVAEDVYSLLALFEHISAVTIVPEVLYFYRVNDQSLSRSYLPNRYRKVKHFYTEAMDLCRRIGYHEDILHRVSKPYLAFTLSAMKQEIRAELPFRQKMTNLKEIIKDDVLQAVLQQNKSDKVSWTRWAIFACMRKKWYVMTYLLLRSKS